MEVTGRVARDHDDAGTLPRQPLRRDPADARRCPGDDDDFAADGWFRHFLILTACQKIRRLRAALVRSARGAPARLSQLFNSVGATSLRCGSAMKNGRQSGRMTTCPRVGPPLRPRVRLADAQRHEIRTEFRGDDLHQGEACEFTAGWPAHARLARTIAAKQAGSAAARESVLLGIGSAFLLISVWSSSRRTGSVAHRPSR